NSFKSMPAENESPAPVITTTATRSSISSASSTLTISSFSAGLIALRLDGRFNVTHAMPSSSSTRTLARGGSNASCSEVLKLVFSQGVASSGANDKLISLADQIKSAKLIRSSTDYLHGLRAPLRLFRLGAQVGQQLLHQRAILLQLSGREAGENVGFDRGRRLVASAQRAPPRLGHRDLEDALAALREIAFDQAVVLQIDDLLDHRLRLDAEQTRQLRGRPLTAAR